MCHENEKNERGMAKPKLMAIIQKHFPRAERLMFQGDTEGTLLMFRNEPGFVELPKDSDPEARYYFELRPFKKMKECIMCHEEAGFVTREYPGKYFCNQYCLADFLEEME